MCLQCLLASIEGQEEENDKDGAQDGEDYHSDDHVYWAEGNCLVCRMVGETVRLVHEITKRPTK